LANFHKALLFLICFFSGSLFAQTHDIMRAAEDWLRAGRFQEALNSANKLPDTLTRLEARKRAYVRGLALEGLGKYAAAKGEWVSYLSNTRSGEENQEYHFALGRFCLGNNCLLRSDLTEADSLFNLALAGGKHFLPDTLLAKIYNSQGVLHMKNGERAKALGSLSKSSTAWVAAGKPARGVVAWFNAVRLQLMSDPGGALELLDSLNFSKTTAMDELHPALPLLVRCDALSRLGRSTEAREYLTMAERVIAADSGKLFRAVNYYNSVEGQLLIQEGRLSEAMARLQKGGKENLAFSVPGETDCRIGLLALLQDKSDLASTHFRRALRILPKERMDLLAFAHDHLGEVLFLKEQYLLALRQLGDAASYWETLGSENHLISNKLRQAEVLLANRDTTNAIKVIESLKSTPALEQSPNLLLRLGERLAESGLPDQAEPLFDRLITSETWVPPLVLAGAFTGKARQRLSVGNTEIALETAQQGLLTLLDNWSYLKNKEGIDLQRGYFDKLSKVAISAALQLGRVTTAVTVAEAVRGMDLKVIQHQPEKENRRGERDRLKRFIEDEVENEFFLVREELIRAKQRLKQLNEEQLLGDELPEKTSVKSLTNLTDKIPPKTSLLYYLRGVDSVYVIRVTEERKEVIRLGSERELNTLLDRYFELISFPITSTKESRKESERKKAEVCHLSVELYDWLIVPLSLPAGEELWVLPTGKLHYLPFAGLITEEPNYPGRFSSHAYLIHRHAVGYLPTLSVLSERDSLMTKEVKMYGFAPNYLPAYGLPALYHNEEEVNELSSLYRGRFVVGDDAVRKVLDQINPSIGILHLGMHAKYDPVTSDSSFLAFAAGERYFAKEIRTDFPVFPFIFLSACQTASGRLNLGDGPLSISRALMAKGNRQLVASLWNVDDKRSGRLIDNFYNEMLQSGTTSLRSLQSAQIAYLSGADHQASYPYYWAGFIHYGTGTKVSPIRKRSLWPFLTGFMVISALLFAYLKRNRKVNLNDRR